MSTKYSAASLFSRSIPINFTRSIHSKSNSSKHVKASSKFVKNSIQKQTYSQPTQQQQKTITKYVEYSYFVARTKTKELPVYIDIRNGGTRILTEISRIEGDSEALCNDIRKEFFYSREKNLVRVNHTNNHVIIKGRHGLMVKEWLAKKGF